MRQGRVGAAKSEMRGNLTKRRSKAVAFLLPLDKIQNLFLSLGEVFHRLLISATNRLSAAWLNASGPGDLPVGITTTDNWTLDQWCTSVHYELFTSCSQPAPCTFAERLIQTGYLSRQRPLHACEHRHPLRIMGGKFHRPPHDAMKNLLSIATSSSFVSMLALALAVGAVSGQDSASSSAVSAALNWTAQ